MKNILKILLCLLLAGNVCAEQVIRYGGATTLQKGYMPFAAEIFELREGVSFKITGGNTGPGMKLLLNGKLDIAGGGRFLTEEEKKAGLQEVLVGWDALIPIVNKKNPVENLTAIQLKDIFSGKIVNWREIGGPDLPVILYTAPKDSGMRKAQKETILDGAAFSPNERRTLSPARAVLNVSAKAGGIAAISKGQILTQSHDKIKMLALDGIRPAPETISNKEYKLIKPLIFATKGPPEGIIERFIRFTLGHEGREIMNRYFFALE